MCTSTYDFVHVHAIVSMQLKFSMHACKSTYEQPHAHRHACRVHTHMHRSVCMLSLPLPYACSL